MPVRDRLVLRAFSIWSVFVWGVLIRNMVKDHTHGTGFRVVHITLAVISISFAVATWMIASRGARRADPGPGPSTPARTPTSEPA